jgi:hypothetical protein
VPPSHLVLQSFYLAEKECSNEEKPKQTQERERKTRYLEKIRSTLERNGNSDSKSEFEKQGINFGLKNWKSRQ